MRRVTIWCVGVMTIALAASAGAEKPAPPSLSKSDLAQAERAARQYLAALAESDRDELKEMRPRELEHQYGPYPFAHSPRLGQPKVDAHRAGLEFQGKPTDPDLPAKGAFILTKVDEDVTQPWRVHSLIWYERLPAGVRMPKTSVTAEDAAEEPRALEAVQTYLQAWRQQDWKQMKALTFDWLSYDSQNRTRARLRSADLSLKVLPDGEVKVDYTARILLFGFLPKTVRGRLYCVREQGDWRVRGDAFLL